MVDRQRAGGAVEINPCVVFVRSTILLCAGRCKERGEVAAAVFAVLFAVLNLRSTRRQCIQPAATTRFTLSDIMIFRLFYGW